MSKLRLPFIKNSGAHALPYDGRYTPPFYPQGGLICRTKIWGVAASEGEQPLVQILEAVWNRKKGSYAIKLYAETSDKTEGGGRKFEHYKYGNYDAVDFETMLEAMQNFETAQHEMGAVILPDSCAPIHIDMTETPHFRDYAMRNNYIFDDTNRLVPCEQGRPTENGTFTETDLQTAKTYAHQVVTFPMLTEPMIQALSKTIQQGLQSTNLMTSDNQEILKYLHHAEIVLKDLHKSMQCMKFAMQDFAKGDVKACMEFLVSGDSLAYGDEYDLYEDQLKTFSFQHELGAEILRVRALVSAYFDAYKYQTQICANSQKISLSRRYPLNEKSWAKLEKSFARFYPAETAKSLVQMAQDPMARIPYPEALETHIEALEKAVEQSITHIKSAPHISYAAWLTDRDALPRYTAQLKMP